jgi:hypothetical protein
LNFPLPNKSFLNNNNPHKVYNNKSAASRIQNNNNAYKIKLKKNNVHKVEFKTKTMPTNFISFVVVYNGSTLWELLLFGILKAADLLL